MGIIRKHSVLMTLFCLAAALLAGSVQAGEINISLAASLKDAITEIGDAFTKTHPGVTVRKNAGASGAIAKQIESGAPADIFLSANTEWMDYLRDKGIVDGKNIGIIAYNSLVFVGRSDLHVKALKDLVLLDKVAIGTPKSVPAGEYAMAALTGAGLARQLETRLVMAKDVRECLMYAERGEVDGAFVYGSDARVMTDKVKVLFAVPQDLYPRVTYPMGLTSSGTRNEDARAFFEFLQTREAKTILTRYGFVIE